MGRIVVVAYKPKPGMDEAGQLFAEFEAVDLITADSGPAHQERTHDH